MWQRSDLDPSPDCLFVIGLAGNIVAANRAMCREFQHSESELLAMNIRDVIPGLRLDQIRAELIQLGETESFGKPGGYSYRENDGKNRHIEVVPSALYSGTHMIGIRGFVRDVTARTEAEDALRESETRFQQLINRLPAVVYKSAAAPADFPFSVSPQVLDLLGYSVGEWLADPELWAKALHPLDRQRILAQTAVLAQGTDLLDLEYRMIARDGRLIWVQDQISLVRDLDGQVLYRQGFMLDITERKQAEEALRHQLDHLTALSRIDRMLAANSDLRLSLSEILTHVTAELGVDAAKVLILNPHSQFLELGAERGLRTKAAYQARVRLGESYAGRAALDRQLIEITDLRTEPTDPFMIQLNASEGIRSYFAVPLIARGLVKGVLEVFHRSVLTPNGEWFDFLTGVAGQAAIAIENATLFESLQRSNTELTLAYDATIEGWSRALDLRDKETEGHTQRVTEMTVDLARAVGLSEAELVQVRWGALLHDIGKMGVSDEILHKSSPLTDDEWMAMKKHPILAHEMLAPIRHLRLALDIPYNHHEKWDGSGYPNGLKGLQIPLAARIFAVVDVWDALKSERPYRAAWTTEKVREHIQSLSGTHFDPKVVEVFEQLTRV